MACNSPSTNNCNKINSTNTNNDYRLNAIVELTPPASACGSNRKQLLKLQAQLQSNNKEDSQTQQHTQLIGSEDVLYNNCYDAEDQQQHLPWGRLTNNFNATVNLNLTPRPSSDKNNDTSITPVLWMGLSLRKGNVFNEYILGRSAKADLVLLPPSLNAEEEPMKNIYHKVHSMISNRHAKIYCLFLDAGKMEVYLEDTSGNGTIVNSTVKLKHGEKRMLHSGDSICFCNPQIVNGVIHNVLQQQSSNNGSVWKQQLLRDIVSHYSFLFVNLYQQQLCTAPLIESSPAAPTNMLPPPNRCFPSPLPRKNIRSSPDGLLLVTSSEAKKRKMFKSNGIVNVRAIQSPSRKIIQEPHQQQLLPDNSSNKHSIKNQKFEEQYDLREILGSGTCGQVRRAIHRKSGKVVAVKIIRIKLPLGLNNNKNAATSAANFVQAEATILQSLSHPYIVQMYDMFVDTNNVYLVMEL